MLDKVMVLKLRDGSEWAVPVDVIARSRAAHYADEHDGNIEDSLKFDTLPLFKASSYEVEDWAANNMNWSDLAPHARQIKPPVPLSYADFQDALLADDKEVRDAA